MANLYGPLWLLAAAGLWGAIKTDSAAWRGVALWFVVVLLLIYVPVNFQRRFMEGWHVPVTILAAAGWLRVIAPRLRTRLTGRSVMLLGVTLLALVVAGPARSAISLTLHFAQQPGDRFFYAHADERGAARWLCAHAEPGPGPFLSVHAVQRLRYQYRTSKRCYGEGALRRSFL